MTPLMGLFLLAIVGLAVVVIALVKATGWGQTAWKAPHRRYVQDYHDGDENLSQGERLALAELEALNLHRRHPYC